MARGKVKDSNGRGGRIRVKVDRPLLLPLLNEVDGRFEQVECAAFALHPPHLALLLSYLVDAKVARVPPGKQCQISHWGEKGIHLTATTPLLTSRFPTVPTSRP